MKLLTIEREKGQKEDFKFLGWKDDGLSFYATRMDGQPAVITPVSAYPNDSSGEPYRFPGIVPLEIAPKRFKLALSNHHCDVFRRWREAKLAEWDAVPFDGVKTPAQINRRWQECSERVESHFNVLVKTPLVELLNPIAHPGALDDFIHGKWANEMGEDFQAMLREVELFEFDYRRAFGEHTDYQEMLWAMCNVRLVMRDEKKPEYPLIDVAVDVRDLTNREAQEYALLGGASPRRRHN